MSIWWSVRAANRQGPGPGHKVVGSQAQMDSQGVWGEFMVCRKYKCGDDRHQVSTFIGNRQVVRGIIDTSSSWELGNTSPTMYVCQHRIHRLCRLLQEPFLGKEGGGVRLASDMFFFSGDTPSKSKKPLETQALWIFTYSSPKEDLEIVS